ncbi:hypothetical protein BH23ACT10_BH23ACT10_14740 [soil metagenome]
MAEHQEPSGYHRLRTVVTGLVAAVLVAGIGVATYVRSPTHTLHSPNHDLQQLDLFYLDEPAPLAARAGVTPGRVTLLLICSGCDGPAVDADVVTTEDPAIAEAYGLATEAGRVGPGYAIIDADGDVRYRTFDPTPGDHGDEIRVLIDNAR